VPPSGKKKPGKELASQKQDIDAAYAAILDGEPLNDKYDDPEVVSRAIVQRILDSDTFEDVFAPQDLKAWGDFEGVPVKVQTFHLNRSAFAGEGGSSIYAVVDMTILSSGEVVTVTCGGRNVLAQLVKMLEKGWFDRPVTLTSKPTAAGYSAQWLTAA